MKSLTFSFWQKWKYSFLLVVFLHLVVFDLWPFRLSYFFWTYCVFPLYHDNIWGHHAGGHIDSFSPKLLIECPLLDILGFDIVLASLYSWEFSCPLSLSLSIHHAVIFFFFKSDDKNMSHIIYSDYIWSVFLEYTYQIPLIKLHESMTEMYSNIYTFGFSSKLHIKHILRNKSWICVIARWL